MDMHGDRIGPRFCGSVSWVRSDTPGWVELHQHVLNRAARSLLSPEGLLHASVPANRDGAHVRLLPRQLFVLHSLVHHNCGKRAGGRGVIPLKGLFEFAWSMQNLTEAEIGTLYTLASANSLLLTAVDFLGFVPSPPFAVHADAAARWQRAKAHVGVDIPFWRRRGQIADLKMSCSRDRLAR